MCRTKFLATRFISDGSSSQNLGLFWNDLSICSFSRFFRQTDVHDVCTDRIKSNFIHILPIQSDLSSS